MNTSNSFILGKWKTLIAAIFCLFLALNQGGLAWGAGASDADAAAFQANEDDQADEEKKDDDEIEYIIVADKNPHSEENQAPEPNSERAAPAPVYSFNHKTKKAELVEDHSGLDLKKAKALKDVSNPFVRGSVALEYITDLNESRHKNESVPEHLKGTVEAYNDINQQNPWTKALKEGAIIRAFSYSNVKVKSGDKEGLVGELTDQDKQDTLRKFDHRLPGKLDLDGSVILPKGMDTRAQHFVYDKTTDKLTHENTEKNNRAAAREAYLKQLQAQDDVTAFTKNNNKGMGAFLSRTWKEYAPRSKQNQADALKNHITKGVPLRYGDKETIKEYAEQKAAGAVLKADELIAQLNLSSEEKGKFLASIQKDYDAKKNKNNQLPSAQTPSQPATGSTSVPGASTKTGGQQEPKPSTTSAAAVSAAEEKTNSLMRRFSAAENQRDLQQLSKDIPSDPRYAWIQKEIQNKAIILAGTMGDLDALSQNLNKVFANNAQAKAEFQAKIMARKKALNAGSLEAEIKKAPNEKSLQDIKQRIDLVFGGSDLKDKTEQAKLHREAAIKHGALEKVEDLRREIKSGKSFGSYDIDQRVSKISGLGDAARIIKKELSDEVVAAGNNKALKQQLLLGFMREALSEENESSLTQPDYWTKKGNKLLNNTGFNSTEKEEIRKQVNAQGEALKAVADLIYEAKIATKDEIEKRVNAIPGLDTKSKAYYIRKGEQLALVTAIENANSEQSVAKLEGKIDSVFAGDPKGASGLKSLAKKKKQEMAIRGLEQGGGAVSKDQNSSTAPSAAGTPEVSQLNTTQVRKQEEKIGDFGTALKNAKTDSEVKKIAIAIASSTLPDHNKNLLKQQARSRAKEINKNNIRSLFAAPDVPSNQDVQAPTKSFGGLLSLFKLPGISSSGSENTNNKGAKPSSDKLPLPNQAGSSSTAENNVPEKVWDGQVPKAAFSGLPQGKAGNVPVPVMKEVTEEQARNVKKFLEAKAANEEAKRQAEEQAKRKEKAEIDLGLAIQRAPSVDSVAEIVKKVEKEFPGRENAIAKNLKAYAEMKTKEINLIGSINSANTMGDLNALSQNITSLFSKNNPGVAHGLQAAVEQKRKQLLEASSLKGKIESTTKIKDLRKVAKKIDAVIAKNSPEAKALEGGLEAKERELRLSFHGDTLIKNGDGVTPFKNLDPAKQKELLKTLHDVDQSPATIDAPKASTSVVYDPNAKKYVNVDKEFVKTNLEAAIKLGQVGIDAKPLRGVKGVQVGLCNRGVCMITIEGSSKIIKTPTEFNSYLPKLDKKILNTNPKLAIDLADNGIDAAPFRSKTLSQLQLKKCDGADCEYDLDGFNWSTISLPKQITGAEAQEYEAKIVELQRTSQSRETLLHEKTEAEKLLPTARSTYDILAAESVDLQNKQAAVKALLSEEGAVTLTPDQEKAIDDLNDFKTIYDYRKVRNNEAQFKDLKGKITTRKTYISKAWSFLRSPEPLPFRQEVINAAENSNDFKEFQGAIGGLIESVMLKSGNKALTSINTNLKTTNGALAIRQQQVNDLTRTLNTADAKRDELLAKEKQQFQAFESPRRRQQIREEAVDSLAKSLPTKFDSADRLINEVLNQKWDNKNAFDEKAGALGLSKDAADKLYNYIFSRRTGEENAIASEVRKNHEQKVIKEAVKELTARPEYAQKQKTIEAILRKAAKTKTQDFSNAIGPDIADLNLDAAASKALWDYAKIMAADSAVSDRNDPAKFDQTLGHAFKEKELPYKTLPEAISKSYDADLLKTNLEKMDSATRARVAQATAQKIESSVNIAKAKIEDLYKIKSLLDNVPSVKLSETKNRALEGKLKKEDDKFSRVQVIDVNNNLKNWNELSAAEKANLLTNNKYNKRWNALPVEERLNVLSNNKYKKAWDKLSYEEKNDLGLNYDAYWNKLTDAEKANLLPKHNSIKEASLHEGYTLVEPNFVSSNEVPLEKRFWKDGATADWTNLALQALQLNGITVPQFINKLECNDYTCVVNEVHYKREQNEIVTKTLEKAFEQERKKLINAQFESEKVPLTKYAGKEVGRSIVPYKSKSGKSIPAVTSPGDMGQSPAMSVALNRDQITELASISKDIADGKSLGSYDIDSRVRAIPGLSAEAKDYYTKQLLNEVIKRQLSPALTKEQKSGLRSLETKIRDGQIGSALIGGKIDELKLPKGAKEFYLEKFGKEFGIDKPKTQRQTEEHKRPGRIKTSEAPVNGVNSTSAKKDNSTVAEQARKAAEEQARKAAEEQARKTAEEQARKAAEEQARKAAEEQARKAAEEQARKVAEKQALQETENKIKAWKAKATTLTLLQDKKDLFNEVTNSTLLSDQKKAIKVELRNLFPQASTSSSSSSSSSSSQPAPQHEKTEKATTHNITEEQARKAAAEQARKAAEEQAKQAAEEQVRKAAEEQAKKAAEEQVRKAAEEQAKKAAEEQARKAEEEQARKAAEEQAKQAAEEQVRKAAEEQARKEAEEHAKQAAEEQARKAAEEQARKEAEEHAKQAAEEEDRKAAAEEQAKKAAAEAAKQNQNNQQAQQSETIETKINFGFDGLSKTVQNKASVLAQQLLEKTYQGNLEQDLASNAFDEGTKAILRVIDSENLSSIKLVPTELHTLLSGKQLNNRDRKKENRAFNGAVSSLNEIAKKAPQKFQQSPITLDTNPPAADASAAGSQPPETASTTAQPKKTTATKGQKTPTTPKKKKKKSAPGGNIKNPFKKPSSTSTGSSSGSSSASDEEAKRKAAEEQQRKAAEEQAKKAAEEQAKKDAAERARKAAQEQARKAAEEQVRKAAEAEAQRRAAEKQTHEKSAKKAAKSSESNIKMPRTETNIFAKVENWVLNKFAPSEQRAVPKHPPIPSNKFVERKSSKPTDLQRTVPKPAMEHSNKPAASKSHKLPDSEKVSDKKVSAETMPSETSGIGVTKKSELKFKAQAKAKAKTQAAEEEEETVAAED